MQKIIFRVKRATINGNRITILKKLPAYTMTDLMLIQINIFVPNVAKQKKERNIIFDRDVHIYIATTVNVQLVKVNI